MAVAACAVVPALTGCPPAEMRAASVFEPVENALLNPSFEDGEFSPDGTPDDWSTSAYDPSAQFFWSDSVAFKGNLSAGISAPTPNDASWIQTITLDPVTNYLLSGWIRTEDVAHNEGVDAGANLNLFGSFNRTEGVFGTSDWTYVSMPFSSGDSGEQTISARVGFFAGTTTGTAWFDDLQVTPIYAQDPHPRWRILAVIFKTTDFTYVDGSGVTHHTVAAMTEEEVIETAAVVETFVLQDIPALDSGNMIPILTIEIPEEPLTQLSAFGTKWWPSPVDTEPYRDPAFDSVIVVWDPRATDQDTGERINLNNAAGLTPNMGTGQAYTSIIVDAAVTYNHRNVFKHEWGHCILDYFEATGASPEPTVTNHATPGQYVHWPTGEDYVWVDETNDNPIPNSIYNDQSGFTHDYYSGTTATPDDLSRRLGITPAAWAIGGPVTRPFRKIQTPAEWLDTIRSLLDESVEIGELVQGNALYAQINGAARMVERGNLRPVANKMDTFERHVDLLVRQGKLSQVQADAIQFAVAGFRDAVE